MCFLNQLYKRGDEPCKKLNEQKANLGKQSEVYCLAHNIILHYSLMKLPITLTKDQHTKLLLLENNNQQTKDLLMSLDR